MPQSKSSKFGFLPVVGLLLVIGMLVGLWRLQQQNLERLDPIRQQAKKLAGTQFSDQKDLFAIEKDVAMAQNAIYVSLIQAVGGVFFFVTAYLSWRTVRASEQKQITERFSKAVEQLDSDKPATKLGGIYALERIAIDSATDHWTIMEVLSYLIRDTSPNTAQTTPISAIAQSALTVISRRKFTQDPAGKTLDLSRTNLTAAKLKGAYFRGAVLEDSNLQHVDLEGADLREVYFGAANLDRANLNHANLNRANKFPDRTVKSIQLSHASLCEATLREVVLTRANLVQSDFTRANLRFAYLYEANLNHAKFVAADLREADLSQANLSDADFDSANLEKAVLHQSNLDRANFIRAKGLTPLQIKEAKHWQNAFYSPRLRQALGLPDEQ